MRGGTSHCTGSSGATAEGLSLFTDEGPSLFRPDSCMLGRPWEGDRVVRCRSPRC